jgi:hypothetical protein
LQRSLALDSCADLANVDETSEITPAVYCKSLFVACDTGFFGAC